MTDDTRVPDRPTRRERLARRSRRVRVVTWITTGVVLAAASAAVAVVAIDDDAPAVGSATVTSIDPFVDRSLSSLRLLAEADPKRPLDHDDPLRLWIGGDSLAGALGIALGDLTGDTGIVETEVDYRVSSGIASDDVRDWPEHAATAIAEHDPEAVAFMVGTNDASIVTSRTAEWEPRYRARVAEMMELLAGDEHRTVIWIGAPTMAESWRDEGVVELNRVMRDEATRHDDVVYVDAYSLFADDDGDYSSTLEGADGEMERVRIGDGVHFTITGARRLATVVFDLLDARWRIRAQADPENPIGFDIADGGEYVGGGTDTGGDDEPAPTTSTDVTTTTVGATTTTAPTSTTTSVSVTTVTTTTPPTTAPTVTTTAQGGPG